MPDITMCKGEGCPVKESCRRYTSTASDRQSYFVSTPGSYGEPLPGLFGEQREWLCEYRIEVKDD